MFVAETFGDPQNPFKEPPAEHLYFDVAFDPTRRAASEVIKFMSTYPDQVSVEEINDRTVRTLTFDCTAPFAYELGLYLNEAELMLEQELPKSRRVPTVITIGDAVVDGQITKRWLTLSRPGREKFGVTGISREYPNNKFEQWKALTMVIGSREGGPHAELWGQANDSGSVATAEMLIEQPDQCFDAHYVALYTAAYRTLKTRLGNREARP